MTVKVKKTEREGANIVKVTLEKEGREYTYTAKLGDVLDENIFKSLLHTWDRMIKEEEAREELKEEDIEKVLKKRAKREIKD